MYVPFQEANSSVIMTAKASAVAPSDSAALDDPLEDGEDDATVCVGVVDLDSVDWWVVVPRPDEDTAEVLGLHSASAEEEKRHVEPTSLDGSYLLVNEDDVVQAVADFVALYMQQVWLRMGAAHAFTLSNRRFPPLRACLTSSCSRCGSVHIINPLVVLALLMPSLCSSCLVLSVSLKRKGSSVACGTGEPHCTQRTPGGP